MKFFPRFLLLTVLSAAFFGCMRGQQTGPGSAINNPAPDFSLKDLNDKMVTLSQYKGKVVILDFYNRYQDKGLVIIGVALDDEGAKVVKPFVDEYKMNYPVVLGNAEVQKNYGGIQGIPTTFIIDKTGKVVDMYTGYRDEQVFEK